MKKVIAGMVVAAVLVAALGAQMAQAGKGGGNPPPLPLPTQSHGCDKSVGNPHCNPKPTALPTAEPTAVPTIEPTAEPQPTLAPPPKPTKPVPQPKPTDAPQQVVTPEAVCSVCMRVVIETCDGEVITLTIKSIKTTE